MVPVYYVSRKSNYKKDSRFDCYDVGRDAFQVIPSVPFIAHPPCRLFSRLRKFSNAPVTEKRLAFKAMRDVRKFGGVVEHPLSSTLWKSFNVGKPSAPDRFGGYLISVNLSWFGFPAEKKTGLYIVGIPYSDLPSLPLKFDAITHVISSSRKSAKKELKGDARSATPKALCDWLFTVVYNIGLLRPR